MRDFFEAYPLNSGRAAAAPVISDHVEDVVLAADALARVPIPPHARFAVFSFRADIRVKLGTVETTFALPVASSADGSGSMLSPAARRIPSSLPDGITAPTHICLRAPVATDGSIEFYG